MERDVGVVSEEDRRARRQDEADLLRPIGRALGRDVKDALQLAGYVRALSEARLAGHGDDDLAARGCAHRHIHGGEDESG